MNIINKAYVLIMLSGLALFTWYVTTYAASDATKITCQVHLTSMHSGTAVCKGKIGDGTHQCVLQGTNTITCE